MVSPIYYFTRSGCVWCKKMQPAIEQINNTLSDEQKIQIHNTDEEKPKELICTYNVNQDDDIDFNLVKNTISLHRKKITNTLYTINALNELIKNLNNGVLDNNFTIPWENFRNKLLVTNSDGLNRISTRIYKIIQLDIENK